MDFSKVLVEFEKKFDASITDSEKKKAEQYAKLKLDRIISREGDAKGDRLKPWYLEQLIAEVIYQNRFSEICIMHNMNIKKDCAAL